MKRKCCLILCCLLLTSLLNGCGKSKGIELTLDNYEDYLNVSCQQNLTDGEDFGILIGANSIGTYVYESMDVSLRVTGKSDNYDYNDVVVTVKISGNYIPFTTDAWRSINKDEITEEEYLTDNIEYFDFDLIADTDIIGSGSSSSTFSFVEANGQFVFSDMVNVGYEVIDVSGEMTPVK